MADIRINALATTAASTASDDFVAVDGSANGTRKLNAYSPTFGGNLTVSGTGTFSGTSTVIGATNGYAWWKDSTPTKAWGIGSNGFAGISGGDGSVIISTYNGSSWTKALEITSSQNATLTGNLTVSGTGTSSVAGSLGIGTTSPTRPLDVRGSLGMQVNEDSAGTKVISIRSDFASAGPAINVTTNDPLLFLTNNSERARITSGGNLGIGTTTPDPTSLGGRALTLSGDFTRARLQLRNTDSSSVGSIAGTLQWMAGSTSLATIDVASETAANTAYLAFSTSASGTIAEAMRISATNRNLLIGTTTDGGQKLQVNGTASFAGSVTATGNGTFGGNSLAGNRILTVSNTATADGSWASMAVDTSASGLKLAHLSSGWSSTFLTGGPTTTQAVIYTSSSAPIVFGVNSTYVGKAESTGWTLAGNLTVSGTQNVLGLPASASALSTNSTMTFELTSNTSLTIKVRGTDGTTRSVALTLA